MIEVEVEVVTGVIIREGRILLAQRPATKSYPLTWETPGGKVEGDESHHDALRRELYEELGLTIRGINQSCMFCDEHPRSSGDGELLLLFYLAHDDWSGTPTSKEGQGWGWFRPEELAGLALAPGNALRSRDLQDVVRNRHRMRDWTPFGGSS